MKWNGIALHQVGPVFRAENSNTARHLCEFTGEIGGSLRHVLNCVQQFAAVCLISDWCWSILANTTTCRHFVDTRIIVLFTSFYFVLSCACIGGLDFEMPIRWHYEEVIKAKNPPKRSVGQGIGVHSRWGHSWDAVLDLSSSWGGPGRFDDLCCERCWGWWLQEHQEELAIIRKMYPSEVLCQDCREDLWFCNSLKWPMCAHVIDHS